MSVHSTSCACPHAWHNEVHLRDVGLRELAKGVEESVVYRRVHWPASAALWGWALVLHSHGRDGTDAMDFAMDWYR